MNLKFSNRKLSRYDSKRGLKLPDEMTEELAYLSGVLTGDGSVYVRKNKNDYIIKCVGNPKDEKGFYNQVIVSLFEKIFCFKLKVGYQDCNTTYGFVIHSKALLKFFTEAIGHSSGRKDKNLSVPKIIKNNKEFEINFIRGLFDTDGCVTFKKRYKKIPYYPVIILSSKSKILIKEIAEFLKSMKFRVNTLLDYKIKDKRFKEGYSIINRLELNGYANLNMWMETIGFSSPKHLTKIKKYGKE